MIPVRNQNGSMMRTMMKVLAPIAVEEHGREAGEVTQGQARGTGCRGTAGRRPGGHLEESARAATGKRQARKPVSDEHTDVLGIHEGEARDAVPEDGAMAPASDSLPPASSRALVEVSSRVSPTCTRRDPPCVQGVVVSLHDLFGEDERAEQDQHPHADEQDQASRAQQDQGASMGMAASQEVRDRV